jgi:hypothetical protein
MPHSPSNEDDQHQSQIQEEHAAFKAQGCEVNCDGDQVELNAAGSQREPSPKKPPSGNDTTTPEKLMREAQLAQVKRAHDEDGKDYGKCEHKGGRADTRPGDTHAVCYQCDIEIPLEVFSKRQKREP